MLFMVHQNQVTAPNAVKYHQQDHPNKLADALEEESFMDIIRCPVADSVVLRDISRLCKRRDR